MAMDVHVRAEGYLGTVSMPGVILMRVQQSLRVCLASLRYLDGLRDATAAF